MILVEAECARNCHTDQQSLLDKHARIDQLHLLINSKLPIRNRH